MLIFQASDADLRSQALVRVQKAFILALILWFLPLSSSEQGQQA